MNREGLFRGKRLDNGEWVYGYYCKHIKRQVCPMDDELKPEDVDHLIIQNGFADWNMPVPLQAHKVDPETVGQDTGLKDRNGVKIFDGDVLACGTEGTVAHIEWSDNYKRDVAVVLSVANVHVDLYKFIPELHCEIIGNIHDNPELLEVE